MTDHTQQARTASIPDTAIEAAHKAWREQAATEGSIFEYNLRAALEAAAPYMHEIQWGVRDNESLTIAAHPSEESARFAASEHPEWYEVVSRPLPRWEPAPQGFTNG